MKNDFQSLESIREAIAKLKTLSWPIYDGEAESVNEYVYKIDRIIYDEFKVLLNLTWTYYSNEFPFKMYRARKLDSSTNPTLITEHSYPPTSFVNLGRCNFPKYPVFYCANDSLTALYETVRNNYKKGDFYALSKWELIDSKEPFDTEFYLKPYFDKNLIQYKVRDKVVLESNFKLEGVSSTQIKGLIEMMEYIQSLFISDTNYNISAALTHKRLYELSEKPPKIIVYPSVLRHKYGINMAINPNFVENKMKLTRIYIVELLDSKDGLEEVLFSPFKIGNVENNSINWKTLMENEKESISYFQEDFFGLPIGVTARKTFYNNGYK